MTRPRIAQPPTPGLTLIELLVVMVIVSVLAGLAWPAFKAAIMKSRRADGTTAISNVMQAQERFRANNSTFAQTLAAMPGIGATSSDGRYTMSLVGTIDAFQYGVRATANSTGGQLDDDPCQVLTVMVNRGQITYSSANSGGVANANDTCWPR